MGRLRDIEEIPKGGIFPVLGPHRRRWRRPTFWYLPFGLVIGGIAGHQLLLDDVERAQVAAFVDRNLPASARPGRRVYFRSCADAWTAGAAPLRKGKSGYRPALDADGDGWACEPVSH